jgi:concanavalin A-like lectin/glucanase superfamily protein
VLLLVLTSCGQLGFERLDAGVGPRDATGVDARGGSDAGPGADGGLDAQVDGGPPPCDYEALVLSLGPRAYWRLGDSGGVAVDSSGNAFHGAYIGGTRAAGAIAGDADLALAVNGVDQYVDLSPSGPIGIINSVAAVTLMAWTRTTTIPSGGTVLLPNFVPVISIRGTDPMLARALLAYVQNDEIWSVGRTDDAAPAPQQLVTTANVYPLDGQWHFVVVEIDFAGDRFRTWIDGVPGPSLAVAFTNTMTQPDDSNSASIGGSTIYDSWFDGEIDEVAVFVRTVTNAEVAGLFACGS